MQTEDGDIIRECLNGDNTAFAFLVDKYRKSVYALAYARIHNFHDAQDIAQEVFIRAYKSLHTLRKWDNFMGWLYRITCNVCKRWNWSNTRRLDSDFIEDHDPDLLDRNSMISYREEMIHQSIREALESLPETYREALTLRYFGGMKVNEIARFLGISSSTVDRRLREALSQLKEETLIMIGTAKEQRELPSTFTFNIVEMIKHIRINPISIKPLPWGLAVTAGIIAFIFGIGQHLNWQTSSELLANSTLSGESKVLEVGEFPVDVANISSIAIVSNQLGNGDGVGSEIPSLQNALFMAPQAGDTWTKKADMPTARLGMSAGTVNGKIHTIGGYTFDNQDILSIVEEYDPKTDTWAKKANMPTERYYLDACAVNGKIYAIGGSNSNGALSIVEEYDPVEDKWAKKADMPTKRWGLSASAVNGRIYAIGGIINQGGNQHLSTVEEYDPIKDRWTKRTDLPRRIHNLSTSVVNGKIYAIGGVDNGVGLSTVYEYNPEKDIWTQKADMPAPKTMFCASTVNGRIYAIGGQGAFNVIAVPTVYEYDPDTDKWVRKTDMPIPRTSHVSGVVNGKIYVIGGWDWNANIATPMVEEYDPGTVGQSINFKGKLPTTWGETKIAQSR